MSYEINKNGEEVIYVKKNAGLLEDSIIITVSDSKVIRVHASTQQADIFQDMRIDRMNGELEKEVQDTDFSEEGLTTGLFPIQIELPDETKQLNYAQALQIYHRVFNLLEVQVKIVEYVPKFTTETELTLTNILGLDNVQDLGEPKKEEEL